MIPNLQSKRDEMVEVARWVFDQVTNLPRDVRPEKRERTGLYFMLRVLGTDNMVIDQAYSPHEATRFFAMEKAVRAELGHDFSSQNTADKDLGRYAGCIAIEVDGKIVQATNSGLKAPEDVLSSVLQLSNAFDMHVADVLINISHNGGDLPDEFYKEKQHYLYELFQPWLEKSFRLVAV